MGVPNANSCTNCDVKSGLRTAKLNAYSTYVNNSLRCVFHVRTNIELYHWSVIIFAKSNQQRDYIEATFDPVTPGVRA